MGFLIPFLAGFFSSSVGVSLPGLINMTAAKISLRDGKIRALSFVSGAIIVIFFQTLAAILFADYISTNFSVLILLKKIGVGLFGILTIYFLFIAKSPKINQDELRIRSKTSRFFIGMLLSALNVFPIPYYVFITISLATSKWFNFDDMSISLFLFGVVLGSFLVFYYYVKFFKNIEAKTDFFMKNMNKIIGTITGIVTLITIIQLCR